MLTVAVLLSGPHRLGMLETALASIPIDSPTVSQVLIRHQNGPWNWGGQLRERMEAHPKVRILEFPDRVDFAHSFNRTFDAITTPWGMLLPDDDYLIRPAAKAGFEAAFAHPDVDRCGLLVFGWYYLKGHRVMPGHLKGTNLNELMRNTPKFSSTVFNMQRVRALGGLPAAVGGLLDTALIGTLAYRYDALITDTPVGAYRMHSGQESAQKLPLDHAQALRERLGNFARTSEERAGFEAKLGALVAPEKNRLSTLKSELSFALRSRDRPGPVETPIKFRSWLRG